MADLKQHEKKQGAQTEPIVTEGKADNKEAKDVNEVKAETETPRDLASIIGGNIASVMRDRRAMTGFKNEVAEWVKNNNNPSPRTLEEKKVIFEMLKNGIQALEGIYIEVQQSLY